MGGIVSVSEEDSSFKRILIILNIGPIQQNVIQGHAFRQEKQDAQVQSAVGGTYLISKKDLGALLSHRLNMSQ